jgi:large repetitive protein
MPRRTWVLYVCAGAVASGLLAAATAVGLGHFPRQTASVRMTVAATLGSDSNVIYLPDPNDANDMTGIIGYIGAYDPNDPNQDPNDPCSVPPICGAAVYVVDGGQIINGAMSSPLGAPDAGMYFVSRLEEGTYDLRVVASGYAAEVIETIDVSFGQPTRVDIYDLVPEGRIAGQVTDWADEVLEPNKVHVWINCASGVLLMVRPDANGDYTIAHVPEGTYTVTAYSRLAKFTPQSDVSVTVGETTSDIDFVGAAEGSISGTVSDSSAAPVDANEVHITVDCGTSGVRAAEPNADGAYLITDVPEGTYTVTALSVAYSFPPVSNVTVAAGEETSGIDFEAAAEGKIAGQVFESDGETPIAGAYVALEPIPEGRDPSLATTDPNGSYLLLNVPPGSNYTVKATHGDDPNDPNTLQPVAQATGISVTEGQTTESVDLTAPSGAISGSLSVAVEGALVTAMKVDTWRTSTATADANGDYLIDNLPPGTYRVSVKATGYFAPSLSDVSVTQGETTGQDFTLTTEGVITGRVTDGSNGIAGAMVTALDGEGGVSSAAPPAITDPNGDYVLGHLAAGSYTVHVAADGYIGDSTVDVTVTVGQTTSGIDFSLGTTGGSITGTVYESDGTTPIPGAFVTGYGSGLTLQASMTDSAGEFELESLLPGTYTVSASAQDFVSDAIEDVSVTAGNTTEGVDFELEAQP